MHIADELRDAVYQYDDRRLSLLVENAFSVGRVDRPDGIPVDSVIHRFDDVDAEEVRARRKAVFAYLAGTKPKSSSWRDYLPSTDVEIRVEIGTFDGPDGAFRRRHRFSRRRKVTTSLMANFRADRDEILREIHDRITAIAESTRPKRQRSHVRDDDLAEILTAYLLHKNRISLAGIAETLWPGPYSRRDQQRGLERRASDRVRTAKKLVDGDWRRL